MGYLTRSGRWADCDELVLLPGGATESVTGAALELGDRAVLRATVHVDSIADASAVTVAIETAEAGEGPWRVLGRFEPLTAPGSVRVSFGALDRWVRARAEVTGDDVRFRVVGEAA